MNTLPSLKSPSALRILIASALALATATSALADTATLLKDEMTALRQRLELINRARHSVDMSYIIMRNDLVGGAIIGELRDAIVRAKREGRDFRVRVILDAGVDKKVTEGMERSLKPAEIKYLHDVGIELKLYNPAKLVENIKDLKLRKAYESVAKRSHDKMMIGDGKFPGGTLITGGRNIDDYYFKLYGENKEERQTEQQFEDLDVRMVDTADRGAVHDAAEYFEQVWNLSLTEDPDLRGPTREAVAAVEEKVNRSQRILRNLFAGESGKKLGVAPSATVDLKRKAWFVHDTPGAKHEEVMASSLYANLETARQKLLIVTPYIVLTDKLKATLLNLLAKGVEITVVLSFSTLWSYDANIGIDAVYEVRDTLKLHEELGLDKSRAIKILEYTGQHDLHAKTYIKDWGTPDAAAFVGSYNFSFRSERHDTEVGVIIDSPEFVGEWIKAWEHILTPKSRLSAYRTLEHVQKAIDKIEATKSYKDQIKSRWLTRTQL
jgi:cardiolipin synthase C